MATRPTPYYALGDTDIVQRMILEWIANGKSVVSFCEQHPGGPRPSTVFSWAVENPEFRRAYIAARMLQADLLVDQVLDIADDKGGDPKRAKLMIETRWKLAGMMRPDQYGDKLDITSAGRALNAIPAGASPSERIDAILKSVRALPAPAPEPQPEERKWSILD